MEIEVLKTPWYFKGAADFVDEWFLMDTPSLVLTILVVYLAFVTKLGPVMMEKRPAFQLRKTIMVYNALQVVYSTYLSWRGFSFLFHHGMFRSDCVTDNKVIHTAVARCIYLYLLAKVSELLDTVFFVLRKKNNQVTFLHVYHHTMVLILAWLMVKYDPNYGFFCIGTFNSFVHIIMYTYYGLSAFPSLKKYLWWKKYITIFQLIQFLLILTHVATASFMSKCRPSNILLVMVIANCIFMIHLFTSFYLKAYTKKHYEVHSSRADILTNMDVSRKIEKPANATSFQNQKNKSM